MGKDTKQKRRWRSGRFSTIRKISSGLLAYTSLTHFRPLVPVIDSRGRNRNSSTRVSLKLGPRKRRAQR